MANETLVPGTGYPGDHVWDDLRFPAQGINPPGAVSDPTISTTTAMLSFSGSADNIIAGIAQMPHSWKPGSSIYPHVHLIYPTANPGKNSRWKFEYSRANNNDVFENAYGSYTTLATITVPSSTSTDYTWLDPDGFGELTMSGYRESCMIMWRITRLASSDAADDDTNAIVLAEFDFHYQIEKAGTRSRTPGAS